MNNYNERVNDEADEHARMMQDQRESFMLKCGAPAVTDREMAEIDAMIADGMQKIHDEPLKAKALEKQQLENTRQAIWTVLGLTLLAIVVVYLSWGGL